MTHTAAVIDWGDVPTWIGAITTLGALIAAGFLVYVEVARDRRTAAEIAGRREAEARAEQADFVVAYPHETIPAMIQVNNASRLPVYNVSLEFVSVEGQGVISLETLDVLTPGEHRAAYPTEIVDITDLGDLNLDLRWQWRMKLKFTDTAGRSWVRDQFGRLDRDSA